MTRSSSPRVAALVSALAATLFSGALVIPLAAAGYGVVRDAWLARHVLRLWALSAATLALLLLVRLLVAFLVARALLPVVVGDVVVILLTGLFVVGVLLTSLAWVLLDLPVGAAAPLPWSARGVRYLLRLRGGSELLDRPGPPTAPAVRAMPVLPAEPTRVDTPRPTVPDATEWVRTSGPGMPVPPVRVVRPG